MLIIHIIVAIVIGYVSFILNSPLHNLIIALAVLAGTIWSTKTLFKIEKKPARWWINNIIIYLFTWLIVWTLFYNTRILV